MPSDYEQICKDNIRRRGEEFDDIGRLISEQLYSDRTHFIYELLQNAEDALGRRKRNNPESELPTSVKFLLHKDRLEFRHFGENFNTNDVKGISDVLKGTKSEDKTQIGKFGIGFKSVYAFTSTPEIHSGDEHFIIERYIRPRSADRIPQIADGETVFVFPFNHKDLSKEQAFQLIEEKLKKIGSRVLLFLRNITEIEWRIETQDEGLYLKESEQQCQFAQKVTVIGQHGNEEEEEEWLVFRRSIETANSSIDDFVEVAFRLIEDKKEGEKTVRRIESSPLVVYFPTKLETRFGFLVHGPYDTTASRSDIEDNEWNRRLIIETADLLTKIVFPWLKENTLLTTSFLEALPIKSEDFPRYSLFRPIYEQVRTTLRNRAFLPTADGKYVAGKHAVLARAEDLVDLINSEQLSSLLNQSQNIEWLTTDITETKKDIHRYLVGWKPPYSWSREEEIESLIVAEIRPQDLIEKLTAAFLKKQSISWLLKLYIFFEKRRALIEKLKNKPVIRLEEGSHVIPFKQDGSPNAYLPPDNDTEFPIVSRAISRNEKALKFLKELGLTKPDAVDEVIDRIVPKYTLDHPDISDDEHMRDMKKILHGYSTDSHTKKEQLRGRLRGCSFIRAENLVLRQVEYKKPAEQLYFRNEELILYFDGNKDTWFVCSEYDECFYDLFKDLGVNNEVYVEREMPGRNQHIVIANFHGWHERGLNGFDPNIKIDGLEHALNYPTIKKSEFIWNKIVLPNAECICGTVELSSRQTYEGSRKKERISESFGQLLMDIPWLPDRQGNFHEPAELKLDDLPESFDRDEKLVDLLGMRKDEIKQIEEKTGCKLIPKEEYDEFQKWKEETSNSEKEKPIFPVNVSTNPDRREERLAEQMDDASEKQYKRRNRSVRTSAEEIDPIPWLRSQYTNINGQIICQICKEDKSFKRRDGEYHFEKKEAFSKDYFPKEHEAQYLSLCPRCAAMYNHFVTNDKEAMESLKDALLNSEDLEIPLQLGEWNTSIRFVKTHFQDIRNILKEIQESNSA